MLIQSRLFFGAGALAMNFVFAGHCYAQQPADIGKTEYVVSCASCHGEDGKGAGPVAGFLKQKVADLTVLQKNSGGAFPFSHVYDVIDGREAVAAHGPRNMPVWGDAFNREGAKLMGYLLTTEDLDSFTRGKIIALVGYIYTLQAK